jgi:hypothetical protein
VGPQIVAEEEVKLVLFVAPFHQMDVKVAFEAVRWLAEEVTTSNASFTLVAIPKVLERQDAVWHYRKVGHNNEQINNGLRCKTSYRRAAYVVDLFHKLTNPGLQVLPLIYKLDWPSWIVLIHDKSRQNESPLKEGQLGHLANRFFLVSGSIVRETLHQMPLTQPGTSAGECRLSSR